MEAAFSGKTSAAFKSGSWIGLCRRTGAANDQGQLDVGGYALLGTRAESKTEPTGTPHYRVILAPWTYIFGRFPLISVETYAIYHF